MPTRAQIRAAVGRRFRKLADELAQRALAYKTPAVGGAAVCRKAGRSSRAKASALIRQTETQNRKNEK